VATMSWSTLWHHCSADDGEACGPRQLLRRWRVATSVASMAAASGGVIVVVAHSRADDATVGMSRSSRPGAGSGLSLSLLLLV
jgi:hypothetical protein